MNSNTINELLQPTFNIGMIGSVANGKSTIVKALTGIETFRHSKEKEKGITIKIGYANCKIFKCQTCPEPENYFPTGSKTKNYQCPKCQSECMVAKYFSFIDCPGHESLMSTMLSGATVMDYAIILVDASQKFPESQQQTVEHLAALEILQVKKMIIIQNKLDIVDGNKAQEQYIDIKNFVKGTCAESAPIIPLSAQKKYNIDILCEFIVKYFDDVDRIVSKPKMNIIRSFDINKPGTMISDIMGGVLGGSLITGEFKIGDIIEIRPGIVQKNDDATLKWKPIKTEIISMKTDNDTINIAKPGGLIGLCTNLDPILTRSDRMVGQVIGLPDNMPDVFIKINAKCIFMKKIGLSNIKINKPVINDTILLNISSKPVLALVKIVNKSTYSFELKYPCCMNIGEKFSISYKSGDSWRLIGMGELMN